MAKDLEASIGAKLYQERVTHELELATKIQQQIIPELIPQISGIEIAADLIPAGEIGGDMYDFLPVAPDRLIFYLGDVTGHGVPAGIVSSISSALFYGYSSLNDIKEIMVEVNRVLKAKTMPNMFMTLCLMEWNSSQNKFSFVNAGHEQILHYRAAEDDVILTPSGGIALGMIPDVNKVLTINTVDFKVGDYLIIYSDGIPEAWRSQKESYGMERFTESLKRNAKTAQTPLALKDALLADLNSFVNSYDQMDDITILVVKKT
jgi:sigma-B regulation protein RsbU (phosphoserine phosphatase)